MKENTPGPGVNNILIIDLLKEQTRKEKF